MKARLLPLEGKYYGTRVQIELGPRNVAEISVWHSDGKPSERECATWGCTQADWVNDRLIDGGWGGKEPARRVFPCDSHYESQTSFEIAEKIVNAINGEAA